jgi:hypothetical protein
MLLQDKRVQPATNGNLVLQVAAVCERVEVMQVLLADTRVNPAVGDNCILLAAVVSGRTGVVRVLLQDRRLDPAWNSSRALLVAVFHDREDVVRALLEDGRADPTVSSSAPLQRALDMDSARIVHAFIADGRADLAAMRPSGCSPATWRAIDAALRWRRRRLWLGAVARETHPNVYPRTWLTLLRPPLQSRAWPPKRSSVQPLLATRKPRWPCWRQGARAQTRGTARRCALLRAEATCACCKPC